MSVGNNGNGNVDKTTTINLYLEQHPYLKFIQIYKVCVCKLAKPFNKPLVRHYEIQILGQKASSLGVVVLGDTNGTDCELFDLHFVGSTSRTLDLMVVALMVVAISVAVCFESS